MMHSAANAKMRSERVQRMVLQSGNQNRSQILRINQRIAQRQPLSAEELCVCRHVMSDERRVAKKLFQVWAQVINRWRVAYLSFVDARETLDAIWYALRRSDERLEWLALYTIPYEPDSADLNDRVLANRRPSHLQVNGDVHWMLRHAFAPFLAACGHGSARSKIGAVV